MKKESIVLITGAGASHDFDSNMELGNSLIRNIKNRVYEQEDEYLSIVVKSIGFDDRLRKEFQTNLSKYINACEKNKSEASIDSLLNSSSKCNEFRKNFIRS